MGHALGAVDNNDGPVFMGDLAISFTGLMVENIGNQRNGNNFCIEVTVFFTSSREWCRPPEEECILTSPLSVWPVAATE